MGYGRLDDGKAVKKFVTSGRFSLICDKALSDVDGLDMGKIRKARRVEQVRNMWRDLVSDVFLDHTNSVFVFDRNGRREMHVYVDESIYAAELNNQREIIKWECLERYGEKIDDFHIHVSRGKYKSLHPFRSHENGRKASKRKKTLDRETLSMIDRTCLKIEDKRLREQFKKAMISDLERNESNEC